MTGTPGKRSASRSARDAIFSLQSCKPHRSYALGDSQELITIAEKRVRSGSLPSVAGYRFENCAFDRQDIEGILFSDCEFENCEWTNTDLGHTLFIECKFSSCRFKDGSWIHVGFRGTAFKSCTFADLSGELVTLVGGALEGTAWSRCSLVHSFFDSCKIAATSFGECVLHAAFRDCDICVGAFDHLVEGESELAIYPTADAPSTAVQVEAGSQDPLAEHRIVRSPTFEQLAELDKLIESETDEQVFQKFLERNIELISVVRDLGHHGLYVLPQVAFGNKHRADFMVGAKNSMGVFWTGLEN